MSASVGPGSAGNVIAALASLFVPGLGHLLQGRIFSALFWLLFGCVAFLITWLLTFSLLPFGWILVCILAAIDTATYRR